MIDTARLILRPWRQEDRPFVAALLADPDVMQFSDNGVLSEEDQAAWLERAIAASVLNAIGCTLAIERRQDTQVLGYVSLSCDVKRVDPGDAEIGFRLAKPAWGYGYATEAALGIIRAARERNLSDRIVAIVDPHNERSLRVLRKAGFKYIKDVMFEGYDYADQVFAYEQKTSDMP